MSHNENQFTNVQQLSHFEEYVERKCKVMFTQPSCSQQLFPLSFVRGFNVKHLSHRIRSVAAFCRRTSTATCPWNYPGRRSGTAGGRGTRTGRAAGHVIGSENGRDGRVSATGIDRRRRVRRPCYSRDRDGRNGRTGRSVHGRRTYVRPGRQWRPPHRAWRKKKQLLGGDFIVFVSICW